MNTDQIDFICSNLDTVIRPYFRGVFSLDNLLYFGDEYLDLETVNVIIFNSQMSDREGMHWLLLVIGPGRQKVVLFDSFANTPEYYSLSLAEFLGKDLELSPFCVQGNSKICSLYCIVVAHCLSKGADLETLIPQKFSPYKLDENDDMVIDWVKQQEYGELLKETCRSELEPCLSYEELKNGND